MTDTHDTVPLAVIPLAVPHIAGSEWDYVRDCLDTGWVSSVGAYVERFEREMAAYVDRTHGVAVASGTAALHTALLVAGIQPGDEVLVSDLTFVAPANAVRYVGAVPVFIGPQADTYQIDPARIRDFLENTCTPSSDGPINRETGRPVRAMIPVHALGHPAEMDPLLELARAHDLTVISDATESLGSLYRGRPAAAFGDIACLSFNGNKIMTTGGGGMLLTDDADMASRARYLTTQAKDDPLEYDHGEVGYNYRLTNVQAAMGCAQLEHMPDFVARKRQIAARYAEALADLPGLRGMPEADWAHSNFWMYTITIDAVTFGMDSRALLRVLQEQRIQTRPVWRPMHRLAPHRDSACYGGEISDRLHRDALSLPCSVGLSDPDQTRVIDVIRQAHQRRV